MYGIDWDGPSVIESISVEIPTTACPLTDLQKSALQLEVNPLAECDDYGISLFVRTKDFVISCLSE